MSAFRLHKSKLTTKAVSDPTQAPSAGLRRSASKPIAAPEPMRFRSQTPSPAAPPHPRTPSAHPSRGPRPSSTRKRSQIAPCVSSLLQVLQDRRLAYQQAASKVHSNRLRSLCMRCSAQSQQFLDELTPILARFGSISLPVGSLLGALGRGWVSVGKVLRSGDRPILAACEWSEDAAIATYTECLESNSLTAQLLPIVARQYNDLLAAHETICDWRDSL